MELSSKEIRDIGIATAQHVLEGLHRYTVDYVPPSSVQQALRDSMVEEKTAADWYAKRIKYCQSVGDMEVGKALYEIRKDEEDHYRIESELLAKRTGEKITPTSIVYKKESPKEIKVCGIGTHELAKIVENMSRLYQAVDENDWDSISKTDLDAVDSSLNKLKSSDCQPSAVSFQDIREAIPLAVKARQGAKVKDMLADTAFSLLGGIPIEA